MQVPSCQESLHVPGFKVRADCSYPPMQCARHNTGCGVACSMPPRIRTGVPELNGVAFATTGAVWHMTQSPFGRVRCDMCIYLRESKSAGNGVQTGNFVGGKARSEEGGFCTRAKAGLHVNHSQGRLSMSMRVRRCLCGSRCTPVLLLQNQRHSGHGIPFRRVAIRFFALLFGSLFFTVFTRPS